jgi:hypothetical protein
MTGWNYPAATIADRAFSKTPETPGHFGGGGWLAINITP